MRLNACDVSLILPAYNESRTIESTLEEVISYFRRRALSCQIIVAADGTDGTRERARAFSSECEIIVIGNDSRQGKGKGIRDAVRVATGNIIGFADADNKVPITEFEKIEPWLQTYDVVIGSRVDTSLIERWQPWYRTAGAWGFYYFVHLVVNLPDVLDSQCGFKFFPKAVAKDLFSRQQVDGYMFDIEILALAQKIGYKVKEVPVRWSDDGDSRLQLFSGNVRNVLDVFKIRSYCAAQAGNAEGARTSATDA